MNVLIIEDEVNAFTYLWGCIVQLRPQAKLLSHVESVEDAVNWLDQGEAPDLIFMDIQLSDGHSFEIFDHIEVESPIIFATAYDEYAINAFKVNSID
ncbi:MAG: response regulator, partial [Bacteroidota bacterium]